ncbi:alpha/beta hydrolase [Rubrivirga litoralis]|uniref:Serine aminopeptidase S33 domain-containing protein n=1 Tax=Rubrivirga litoralis TaxID=3075598 RepID=A0ABU3BR18_9BACT|nr:hypothetical protein [Rubrivirga sp. F394]MDT0631740.1 hypothetical protein [Rubrivirga sp. F394]
MSRAFCLAALLVSASGCSSIDITEHGLIHPRRAESSPEVVPGAVAAAFPGVAYEEQRIKAADGTILYGALLRQPGADLTVLYFGGNEFTVESSGLGTAQALLPLGINLLLIDHRGYGWSDGTPTVSLLQSDALDVFDHAAALPDLGSLVAHGFSLGSFLAGHVGANRPAAGVVLESSATTPEEWASVRIPSLYRPFVTVQVDGPLRIVDNRAEVERIGEPLLLLAGDEDATTPPVLSRRLYEASPLPASRKTLAVIAGAGHGDVQQQPEFARVYQAFLDRVRATREPRP